MTWKFSLGLFAFCLAYFGFLSAVPAFVDPDAYYHAKMAQLIAEQGGPVAGFPWLSLTSLGEDFVDHQFLYHVLLVPFVTAFPPLVGIKVATVLFASLFVVFLAWLSLSSPRRRGSSSDMMDSRFRGNDKERGNDTNNYYALRVTRYGLPILFLLLLLTQSTFIFRLGLAKTSAVALLFFFGAIALILARRTILLGVLSFFYVWLYGGWPLVLVAAGIAWVAQSVIPSEVEGSDRFLATLGMTLTGLPHRLRLLAMTAWSVGVPHVLLGTGAGLVFSPYFPENLHFYALQTLQFPLSLGAPAVGVGREWYSSGLALVPENILAVGGVLAAIGVLAWHVRALRTRVSVIPSTGEESTFADHHHRSLGSACAPLGMTYEKIFLCGLTLATLALAIKSNRHIEYFTPMAFLFIGRTLAPILCHRDAGSRGDPASKMFPLDCFTSFATTLSLPLSRLARRFVQRSFWFHFTAAYLIVAFGFITFVNAERIIVGHRSASFFGFHTFDGAAGWLSKHTKEGSRVWHDRWDDFPLLFFSNNHNNYISGLDPRFLCAKNMRLCREYEQIADGTVKRGVAEMIKKDFDASIVVVRTINTPLIEKLKKEKIPVAYEDSFVKIFEL